MTAMSPAADPGRREQAKADRRLRIVRAAKDLIRETGDTNLSMRMIAQRAEVSIATPYNLFGSKRAVVMAVLEDERDFLHRFKALKFDNAIDRLFEANALGAGYFIEDPDFYRPLWKALLDTNGQDNTGLASPERQEQTRAAWRWLIMQAQDEGLLDPAIPAELLERTLSHLGNGIMLSWAMGTLPTRELLASAALGYALVLTSAATGNGRPLLDLQIARNRKLLEMARSA